MSYLNLDEHYFDNIKVKRLAAKLGYGAELLPLQLWCHAAHHFPENGIFKNYTPNEMKAFCQWPGDANSMLAALLELEFLMQLADNTYQINDWEEHQGHIISFKIRGKKNAEKRWAEYRSNKKNASSIANSNAKKKSGNAPTYYTNLPTKPNNKSGEKPVHTLFVESFSLNYEKATGTPYRAKKEDYINTFKLIEEHTIDVVKLKAKILLGLCREKSAWFTKDGYGAFTLGTLTGRWNEIVENKDKQEVELL